MSESSRLLLQASNRLSVDAVTQTPECISEQDNVSERYEYARKQHFTLLPLRESEGIHRAVESARLEGIRSWEDVVKHARPLKIFDIVSRGAPLFSVLERLQNRNVLFTMGSAGIDGIVTIFDINQPAAHLAAFGFALVVEEAISDALRQALGAGDVMAMKPELLRLAASSGKVSAESMSRLQKAGISDEFLDLLSCLNFWEKVEVLKQNSRALQIALNKTLPRHGGSRDRLLTDLDMIRSLRNAVAHASGDLDNYDRTYRWMLAASAVAQLLSADGHDSSAIVLR